MDTKQIHYREGYKYQLTTDYTLIIPIKGFLISTEYIRLDTLGNLFIKEGYAWDGPSGPTFDTKNSMRGSLVHDALYQLIRERYLDEDPWRLVADDILWDIIREDGMNWFRAWYWLKGVRIFGESCANPKNEPPILTAP